MLEFVKIIIVPAFIAIFSSYVTYVFQTPSQKQNLYYRFKTFEVPIPDLDLDKDSDHTYTGKINDFIKSMKTNYFSSYNTSDIGSLVIKNDDMKTIKNINVEFFRPTAVIYQISKFSGRQNLVLDVNNNKSISLLEIDPGESINIVILYRSVSKGQHPFKVVANGLKIDERVDFETGDEFKDSLIKITNDYAFLIFISLIFGFVMFFTLVFVAVVQACAYKGQKWAYFVYKEKDIIRMESLFSQIRSTRMVQKSDKIHD